MFGRRFFGLHGLALAVLDLRSEMVVKASFQLYQHRNSDCAYFVAASYFPLDLISV
jgi:hypothetical protein